MAVKKSGLFPGWVMVAGGVFGGVTILFLMALIILGVFGREVPSGYRFLIVSVIALGLALSSAFIGGDAAAKGQIPIPLLNQHPLTFSVAGGVATFIIVLLLGNLLYSSKPSETLNEQTLSVVHQLRDDFRRAREALEKSGNADFSRVEEGISALLRIDQQNGHAWYYAGEVKRIQNSVRFNVKSCFKRPPSGETFSFNTYRQDFYRYLEIERMLPAHETRGDTGSEVCYQRPKGYCMQRTGWINHLLANDFYEEALVVTDPRDRKAKLESAKNHAKAARDYYPPKGFEQCTDTIALQSRIDEMLEALAPRR